MVLQKFQFRPGINTELPDYANENGWSDGDKIRFRVGYPEKIGGWARKGEGQYIGSARALKPWLDLSLDSLIGVGTHLKYFIEDGGILLKLDDGTNIIDALNIKEVDPEECICCGGYKGVKFKFKIHPFIRMIKHKYRK